MNSYINLNIIIISILGILSIMDNNYLQKLFNYKIITVIYLVGLCYIGNKQLPLISLFMAILYLVVNNKKVTTENFQNEDEGDDSTDEDEPDSTDDEDGGESTDEEDGKDDKDGKDENDENDESDDDSDDDITESFTNGKKQYRLDNNLRKLNNAVKNFDF